MENKKLLQFLMKDLNELEELFEEKENGSFDNLEMEFLQSRLKSSKKLVYLLLERDNQLKEEKVIKIKSEPITSETSGEIVQEEMQKVEETIISENKAPSVVITEQSGIEGKDEEDKFDKEEDIQDSLVEEKVETENTKIEELNLEEEEEVIESKSKTLGDSFLKEKSVNDLIEGASGKLEHKLSNRPVESIQTAIGINDRFQYIRELFDGNTDIFTKTVVEIDSMHGLKEAVNYLQQNFKWKKNETSLKFVNLVKRRFPND